MKLNDYNYSVYYEQVMFKPKNTDEWPDYCNFKLEKAVNNSLASSGATLRESCENVYDFYLNGKKIIDDKTISTFLDPLGLTKLDNNE